MHSGGGLEEENINIHYVTDIASYLGSIVRRGHVVRFGVSRGHLGAFGLGVEPALLEGF